MVCHLAHQIKTNRSTILLPINFAQTGARQAKMQYFKDTNKATTLTNLPSLAGLIRLLRRAVHFLTNVQNVVYQTLGVGRVPCQHL